MHTQQSRLPLTTYSQAVRAPLTFVEKYSRSKIRTWKLVDISPEEQRDGHGDHHHRQHRGQLGREALRQVLGQNAFFLRTHRRRAKTISDVKQPRDMSSPAPSRKTRAWPQHLASPPPVQCPSALLIRGHNNNTSHIDAVHMYKTCLIQLGLNS